MSAGPAEAGAADRPPPFAVLDCPLDGVTALEASAGTGKTWHLCQLYLRLLLERGLEVGQILVVTFTTAATAELRQRLRERLTEALQALRAEALPAPASPAARLLHELLAGAAQGLIRGQGLEPPQARAELIRRLELASQIFDEAAVFTIHGFCQRALGLAPLAAGRPAQAASLVQDAPLRLEVVQDFWRRRLAGPVPPSPAAAASAALRVEYLLDRGDTPATLARLLERRLARPLARLRWPPALDLPAREPEVTALRSCFTAVRAMWQGEAGQRALILARVAEARGLNQARYRPGAADQAAREWDALLARPLPPARLARGHRLHLLASRSLTPNKGQPGAQEHPFFALAQTLLDLHAAVEQDLGRERLRLVRELLEDGPRALRELKASRRVVAFDDLLGDLHQRLAGEAGGRLAQQLRQNFPAALIDEFQDTDPLQFAIFSAIYGREGPLFLIGDPKQAIYRFRNADLHAYLRAVAQAPRRFALAENQRATAGLIAGLNGLFQANPQAFLLASVPYLPVRAGLRPRAVLTERQPPPGGTAAPWQFWQLPPGEDGEPLAKAEARQCAVAATAEEIVRLLRAGSRGEIRLDERPLRAGDLAVLVQTHAQGALMRAALERAGVACAELSPASVFASPQAEELARVLEAVLDPRREGALNAALATELLGHDALAIADLAADEARLLAVIRRFDGHLADWHQRGTGPMLRALIAGEGIAGRLLARPGGERRLANLFHLAELCQDASLQEPGPEALLRWLQAQRHAGQEPADETAQLRLESDRMLVQIITIHRAKGLEFPFVFCPFLWEGSAGRRGEADLLEYHDATEGAVLDFRFGPDVAQGAGAAEAAEAAQAQASAREDAAAERVRLLYVALTRAAHRCHAVVGAYRTAVGAGWSDLECRRATINWLVAGSGLAPARWVLEGLPKWPAATAATALDAAWAEWADRTNALAPGVAEPAATAAAGQAAGVPVVDLRRIPPLRGLRLQPDLGAAGHAVALAPPARLPAGWRLGSYSSLSRNLAHERAAIDHDLHVDSAPADADEAGDTAVRVAPDDLLLFPRGPYAGECLHALLERADFADPTTWSRTIDEVLGDFPEMGDPAGRGDVPGAAPLRPMLLRLLADLHAWTLPAPAAGLRFGDLARSRRSVEMEFALPAPALPAEDLARLLRDEGYVLPGLAFGRLEGYLRGFIDLVFEHGGQYFLLDWKSNFLGASPADYNETRVAGEMARHGYALQFLLYSVALHRLLRQRLADYDYDRHFGGLFYVFLRAVRQPAGVLAHRPRRATIERLSALIDPAGEAR